MKQLLPLCILATATCLAADPSEPAPSLPQSLPDAPGHFGTANGNQSRRAWNITFAQAAAPGQLGQAGQAARGAAFRTAPGATLAPGEEEPESGAIGGAGIGGMGGAGGIEGPLLGDLPVLPPGRVPAASLVLQFDKSAPGTVPDIQEDLAVMSRILNKKVLREFGRPATESAMGIALSTAPAAQRPQSLYLEGYGALFFLNLRFPLIAPEHGTEEKVEAAPDSDWDQAKRELYGSRQSSLRLWAPGNDNGWAVSYGEAPMEYRAERVEKLKKEILDTLKDATHIRNLKPEEFVTVSVTGPRSGGNIIRTKRAAINSGRAPGRVEFVYSSPDSDRLGGRQSVLTIRAKKSDIDAFAQGKIEAGEFIQRAAVANY